MKSYLLKNYLFFVLIFFNILITINLNSLSFGGTVYDGLCFLIFFGHIFIMIRYRNLFKWKKLFFFIFLFKMIPCWVGGISLYFYYITLFLFPFSIKSIIKRSFLMMFSSCSLIFFLTIQSYKMSQITYYDRSNYICYNKDVIYEGEIYLDGEIISPDFIRFRVVEKKKILYIEKVLEIYRKTIYYDEESYQKYNCME